jgi:hypothetical protein
VCEEQRFDCRLLVLALLGMDHAESAALVGGKARESEVFFGKRRLSSE